MSRKRKENFSGYDKDILLNLIEPQKGILESKKNDIKTLQERTKIWDSICLEFNGDSAIRVQRKVQELKDLYKRLKVEAKKQYTDYNKQTKTTGGGEKPQSPDKYSKAVFSLIPQAFVSYDNQYDDDNDSNSSVKETQDSLSTDNTNTDSATVSCVSQTLSSAPLTPTPPKPSETSSQSDYSFLRHQTASSSSKESFTKKKKSSEKSLEEVMKKYAAEEHALRMDYLKEKKSAKLELLNLKKQNEISKAELLARKISQFDNSNPVFIPPVGNIYQNL